MGGFIYYNLTLFFSQYWYSYFYEWLRQEIIKEHFKFKEYAKSRYKYDLKILIQTKDLN